MDVGPGYEEIAESRCDEDGIYQRIHRLICCIELKKNTCSKNKHRHEYCFKSQSHCKLMNHYTYALGDNELVFLSASTEVDGS